MNILPESTVQSLPRSAQIVLDTLPVHPPIPAGEALKLAQESVAKFSPQQCEHGLRVLLQNNWAKQTTGGDENTGYRAEYSRTVSTWDQAVAEEVGVRQVPPEQQLMQALQALEPDETERAETILDRIRKLRDELSRLEAAAIAHLG